ncbi:hydantoinase/oxoprolinase N-terminal domain-containing protein [Methanimicrococcus blatticola]|uniref:hydantoinase/oxoprolinase N-terminal domain-containing protein n=1 Tax=Methanimicrococcus blatticola TaxID=91560 RepID=UPI0014150098|nr:hydantoinase/oxoprolinase family protein [Methanimicrococcus blatticola]MBZ3935604.1 hydantoinase/oxoprolinase family protein [Methanimicrococcus blatticola]MCC2509245.1 hydantoinase/oxoprolinase family protein [Methanimicrococcus blatticola]
MTNISLGIDAGGTYTDAALVDMDDRRILQSQKALTTYPNPLRGIQNVLDLLDPAILKQVKLLSVSTTFATNTILEKNGAPVSLILIGSQKVPEHLKDNCVVVKGGHNYRGAENEELDLDGIREYVLSVKDKVSAFAVSSFYSILNPDHEKAARQLIHELTGYPVVCGYELAQSLGAYERGVTAYLNASLLPVARVFLEAVAEETKRRGMKVKTTMLKCNGAVAMFGEVMDRPVETIFSGPAASVLGASFLSGKETCLAIDVGGTSTDVSMIEDGIPQISDLGATVGGWKTKVRAIKMETIAAGGDSHIWIKADNVVDARLPSVMIGPRRVIPICRAAVMYPKFADTLKDHWAAHNMSLSEFLQKTTLVLRSGYEASNLSSDEMKAYQKIGDEPVFLDDLNWKDFPEGEIPFDIIETLVNKRLIQLIGFTPTDVLHVTGEFVQWDVEAAQLGARKLAEIFNMAKEDFCRFIKRKFAKIMAVEAVLFLNDTFSRDELNLFMDKFGGTGNGSYLRFKSDIPIILIGAPVQCFISELGEYLDAEIIAPEHYAVGNAVGCLAGKLAKRIEIRVEVESKEEENGDWTIRYTTFTTEGQRSFPTKDAAVHYAETFAKKDIYKYMKENDINEPDVEIRVKTKEMIYDPQKPPVQIDVLVEGFAENKV